MTGHHKTIPTRPQTTTWRSKGFSPRASDFRASPLNRLFTMVAMRDHNKLKAFQLADTLTVAVYRGTGGFPRHELFGLAQQLRRAAVSCASNIVEGCARNSEGDYLRFLDMAYGSVCEVQYQLSLAERLGYLRDEDTQSLKNTCLETSKVLNALIRSLRRTRPEV